MKVLVIGGGISPERKISLLSAQAVYDAAKVGGHEAVLYDWDGTTEWLAQNIASFDVALPILHGKGGEDGHIQKLLEQFSTPFVGTSSAASEICIDKQKTQAILAKAGVLVPSGEVVSYSRYLSHPLYAGPHVVKPFTGGSSIDTFIYDEAPSEVSPEVVEAFGRYGTMLLEGFIAGVEITVPILDGYDLPIIEIVPPAHGFFDYKNKYNGKTKELCPPESITAEQQKQAKSLGRKVHDILHCRDLSRIDIIVSKGKLYTLEANTMPGMTAHSLFPLAASRVGLDMTTLVNVFIKLAGEKRSA